MSFPKSRGSRALTAAALGLCLLLGGCGSKVNKENLDKVKVGMTQAEVEGILGAGTVSNSTAVSVPGVVSVSGKQETWSDGDKQIVVTYANDKVQLVTNKGL